LGFGPYEFHFIFPEDPHNTFLNAFASYGWLGGLSYFALVVISIWVACRTVFRASPHRDLAIPVFATLICLFLQGVQIDTDHWRHFYWLLGFMWGLFLAAELARQNEGVTS
jgi:O-antigen ligase